MNRDLKLLLIAAILPAVFILPFRVRFRIKSGWLRLLCSVLLSWPVVAWIATREIDRVIAASAGTDVVYDGVGDRVAFVLGGWVMPLVCALFFLLIRYAIDRMVYSEPVGFAVLANDGTR